MLVAVALGGVAGRGRECGLPLAQWGAIQTKVLSVQVAAEVREACRWLGRKCSVSRVRLCCLCFSAFSLPREGCLTRLLPPSCSRSIVDAEGRCVLGGIAKTVGALCPVAGSIDVEVLVGRAGVGQWYE